MSNNIQHQAKELAQYFRAAAEQRRLLEPRRDDRYRTEIGKKTVLHAVDVDVVKLFTDPFEVAVRNERRHYGYGEVFPDEGKDNAIGVGRVLAHFIFYQLGGKYPPPPLLLLPPIDQELREVFRGVMRDAMLEGNKAREQVAEVQKLSAQLENIEDRDEQVSLLVEAAPDLFRFLAGTRGMCAEMERFSRLVGNKRIAPLDQALDQHLGSIDTWQQAFQPPTNLADRIQFVARSRFWFDEIMKKPRAKSASRVQDDALMLTRLEWINKQLPDNVRLVLITGDQTIHEAAQAYIPENKKLCFADLWLRHPRSYLAEPEVLSPETQAGKIEAETDFIKWLDTFLGKLELSGSDYRGALGKLLADPLEELEGKALNVLNSHPKVLEEFKQRWSTYTRVALLNHKFVGTSEPANSGGNEQVAQLAAKTLGHLEVVEQVLDNEISEKWVAVFNSAIEAGFLFVRQEGKRSRNPPVLYFESLPQARKFVRKVLEADTQNEITDFVKDVNELRIEEKSEYTYTLAFGMLFAAQGSWSVAAILAERALDLVKKVQDGSLITGREAHYLQAVARRHKIRKLADLEKIAISLNNAQACLDEERQTRQQHLDGDYRFASERVALNVTYRLFERFSNKSIQDDVPTLDQIEISIKGLIEKNADRWLQSNDEPKKWVARNVERKLLVNLFMVSLLHADGTQPFPEALRTYFKLFKQSVECNQNPIPKTFYVESLYLVYQWWQENDALEKKKLRKMIQNYLADNQIQEKSIMPYDIARFTYLRSFVGQ